MSSLSPALGYSRSIVVSASSVNITDAGGYYTGLNVEAALQEIGSSLSSLSSTYVPYTGATGDVNIGTNHLIAHGIQAYDTAGIHLHSQNGTEIGFLGAANTANVLWYGTHRINYNGASPLLIYDTAGTTNLLDFSTTGQLKLPTQGSTGGVLIGTDALIYRDTTDSLRTPDTFRADNGFSAGAAVSSTIYNNFAKTYSSSVASPTTHSVATTITAANTGFASGILLNSTLNISSGSSSGIGSLFGFATLSQGNLAGTAYGLFYATRDSRTGTNSSTTIAGINAYAQIGSTCNTVYSNAVYGSIYSILDLSTGGAVPTSPHAAGVVSTLTIGNLSVANAWRYIWVLPGTGTTSAPVYGWEVGRITNSTTLNMAIMLDGTNEDANGFQWGTTNWVRLNRSANNTAKFESASGSATVLSTGTFSAPQLVSTVATGTSPLTVSSTTKVTNLNSDLLDDQTGSYYLDRANHTGTQAASTITGLYTSVAKGTDYTLLSTDIGKTYYNTAAITLTLPTGVDGYRYRFLVQNANYLKVQAVGTDVIRYVDTVSAAAGYVRSNTVGNTIEMEFANGTWFIHSLDAKEANPWLVDE